MPQEIKQSTVNSFIRGLVTETTPLTFPEGASVDELNCSLERSGLRTRRLGIEFETDYELSTFTLAQGVQVHTQTWENAGNVSGVEFLVAQVGNNLYFYDKGVEPISTAQKSFSVNLNAFSAGNSESISGSRISADSVEGNLVVVSAAINPFYIEYDATADTISTSTISPKVRDFDWQGDVLGYGTPVTGANVTPARKYDTINSGWVTQSSAGDAVLSVYKSDTGGNYPQLTHPWFSGLDANGAFNRKAWQRVYGGNSLGGNGKFILDLFSKDRAQAMLDDPLVSETVPTIAVEVESTRFTTIVGYAGRAWFAGLGSKKNSNKVFFSSVIQNMQDVGRFYQEADPTSQHDSDLVDSDGGSLTIRGANNIKALFEWGSSILIFAENGVWEVKGVDGVFKATEFSVNRLRDTGGILNAQSLVDAEGNVVWWGSTGIYTIKADDVTSAPVGIDLTKGTIQNFWEAIPSDQRARAVGNYDQLNKQIFWLYGNDSTVDYKYNRVLILDTVLEAFVPWEFSDEAASTSYVVGMSFFSGSGLATQTNDVVEDPDDVVETPDDVVQDQTVFVTNGQTEIKFLVRDGATGKLTFATISSTTFLDWGSADYSSYAEAGYDFEDDITQRKNNIYVTVYFNITETGFTGDETSGYDLVRPSSCLLKAYWDLRNGVSSSQQAYRFLRPVIVDTGDLDSFNYPYDAVVTRNKVRGRGRVLKLRFESETGKDFQLQGYEVLNAKNSGL